MRHRRPRALRPAQLLFLACTTISTRGFLRSTALHHTGFRLFTTTSSCCPRPCRRQPPQQEQRSCYGSTRARRRRQRFPTLHGQPDGFKTGDGYQGQEHGLDDDPLPKTMAELYRQMRVNPPAHARTGDDWFVPDPKEQAIIEKAARDVFQHTEDNSWWEENRDELEWIVNNPSMAFDGVEDDGKSSGRKRGFVWGFDKIYGDDTAFDEAMLGALQPFSLSKYKAGRGHGRGATLFGNSEELLMATPFGQYWESLPDLRVSRKVYAYNAVDRIAALKYMMNCTYNGMHGSKDTHQAGHFLWGYVDQLDWMRRSGRLSPNTPGSIKIDRESWWGHVSYALTIAPLAAAVESGVFEDHSSGVSILDGEELQRPEMRRVVRAWRRVWLYSDPDITTRVTLDLPVHDSLQEGLRRAQWAAHLESLSAVEALHGAALDALPPAEREFARGWCRAARLFAVAAAHTDLDKLIFPLGAGYPPERILEEKEEDASDGSHAAAGRACESVPYGPLHVVAEAEDDPVVRRNTQRCVRTVRWLGTLPGPAFAVLCLLWRRACVSYPARRGAARALRRACYGGLRGKAGAVGRSIAYMFVPNLNYRKLSPPFGIDPAEEVEYDPELEPGDPLKLKPRPPGSRPLNPLQQPWYDGPRPQVRDGRPDEDGDDGLGSSAGGMFPPGTEPPDMGFEAYEIAKKKIEEKRQRVMEMRRQMMEEGGTRGRDSSRGASVGTHSAVKGRYASDAVGEEDRRKPVDVDGESPANYTTTVFT